MLWRRDVVLVASANVDLQVRIMRHRVQEINSAVYSVVV